MTDNRLHFLRSFLKERSGLILGEEKRYLLESRLAPVMQRHGVKDLEELSLLLQRGVNRSLDAAVVEAMATHETFFFRDHRPFEQFQNHVLPKLLQARAGQRKIRIWSAACSYGQEAYSLAMILREQEDAGLAGWQFDIVGTDISIGALERARSGLYSQFEVQRGLTPQRLVQHFSKEKEGWRIKPALRAMVEFRYFNLLEGAASLGQFDVVFLRNVLIYFDPETKARVLRNVARQMAPDAILFLGAAETTLGVSDELRPFPGHHGLYVFSPAGVSVASSPLSSVG